MLKRYSDLTEGDVKALVIDDKWHATVTARIVSEVNSLTLNLVGRIQQLGERYAKTLGELDAQLAQLNNRIVGHLADMGVE